MDNVFTVVEIICNQFKDLIENKGLFKLIVNKNNERISENNAQLIFFGFAYSHCESNDLKISPEVDSGNGPVDFNFSVGFKANLNIEMKFADNPKIENGIWSQLQIYNNAENTKRSIYLVIKTNSNYDKKIEQLIRIADIKRSKGINVPVIIVVDSHFRASASVR